MWHRYIQAQMAPQTIYNYFLFWVMKVLKSVMRKSKALCSQVKCNSDCFLPVLALVAGVIG